MSKPVDPSRVPRPPTSLLASERKRTIPRLQDTVADLSTDLPTYPPLPTLPTLPTIAPPGARVLRVLGKAVFGSVGAHIGRTLAEARRDTKRLETT